MPITPRWNRSDIERRFSRFLDIVERRAIDRLKYLGEMCVTHAREVPQSVGFTDQTGNLRASIGYMVFKHGQVIHNGFDGLDGPSEGKTKGEAVAKKAASNYPKGLVLVVVAGMNYALAVESKGRDVLTSAELLAKRELPVLLEELKKNISKSL